MSKKIESSRNSAEAAGKPMGPKTAKTKAVDAGKSAGNPTGERAKAKGHEEHESEKNKNLPKQP